MKLFTSCHLPDLQPKNNVFSKGIELSVRSTPLVLSAAGGSGVFPVFGTKHGKHTTPTSSKNISIYKSWFNRVTIEHRHPGSVVWIFAHRATFL